MLLFILLLLSLAISAIAIQIGISISHAVGIFDHPGEHKQHKASTPFVGGLGIFCALIVALHATDYFQLSLIQYVWLEVATSIMFLTGLADDIWHLDYKLRFLIQAVAALIMALLGGVLLIDLGHLITYQPFELGVFALPFTVFATTGIINALNMIDGIDGLSGSISLVSLMLIAVVAIVAGETTQLALAVVLIGGVCGFLCFNLRYGPRRRAAVFLGDNGSMLLGLLFAWLLVDLTQGDNRAMTPVTALWLFAVPLMDAVGAMVRRLYYRNSPFHPDRNHLHHLFVRAGFRTSDIVFIIATIQFVFGGFGLFGLYAGIPESWMLWCFVAIFIAYCYLIVQPWRFLVPTLLVLRNRLGFISAECLGVFVGNFPITDDGLKRFIPMLIEGLGSRSDYELSVYELQLKDRNERSLFGIIKLFTNEDEVSASEIKGLVGILKKQFQESPSVTVRQFIKRNNRSEQRTRSNFAFEDYLSMDRRIKCHKDLLFRQHGDDVSVLNLLKWDTVS